MARTLRMIKYCDVCETFKQWLAENGHRFKRKLRVASIIEGMLAIENTGSYG